MQRDFDSLGTVLFLTVLFFNRADDTKTPVAAIDGVAKFENVNRSETSQSRIKKERWRPRKIFAFLS